MITHWPQEPGREATAVRKIRTLEKLPDSTGFSNKSLFRGTVYFPDKSWVQSLNFRLYGIKDFFVFR
jgi:hypothetical protein